MSEQTESVSVRTNRTYRVAEPKGEVAYVLKFSPEQVQDFQEKLGEALVSDEGITMFFNVYENESTHDDAKEGDTYLSTVMDIRETLPREDSPKFKSKSAKGAAGRDAARSGIKKSFKKSFQRNAR